MAEAGEPQAPGILDLPDDLLAACLDLVGADGMEHGLAAAQLTCKKFRHAVVHHQLWEAACRRALPLLAATSPRWLDVQDSAPHCSDPSCSRSALFKRLWAAVQAPPTRRTLIEAPMAVTSTDDPRENAQNVLDPVARSRSRLCYWSSAASDEVGSSEAMLLYLRPHLALVTAVQLRPFRAWFQPGEPIYAPQRLRVCINPLQRSHAFKFTPEALREELDLPALTPGLNVATGEYVSPEFVVRQSDEVQTFAIPPTLCFTHEVRVELLGRTQRQEVDGRYYTCLCFVRVVGAPLRHFSLCRPQDWGDGAGWKLRQHPDNGPGTFDMEASSDGSLSEAASQTDPDEAYDEDTELEVAPVGAVPDMAIAAAALGMMPWQAAMWAVAQESDGSESDGGSGGDGGSSGEDWADGEGESEDDSEAEPEGGLEAKS